MSGTYQAAYSPLYSNAYYFKRPCPVPPENRLRIPENNSFNFYVITKYICALLNSKGGTLLIGVESDFTVRGRKLNREEIDKFQRHVDEALKQFNPSVKGHEYSINFHPVNFDEGKKIVVKDFYVIEITINNSDADDLYFTHYDECWIKNQDNQIDQVPVTELRYIEIISRFEETFQFYALSLLNFFLLNFSPKTLLEISWRKI